MALVDQVHQCIGIVPVRDHVIGEDRGEHLLVLGLEEGLHRAVRQQLEGRVGLRVVVA
jgi:hypothetical protein